MKNNTNEILNTQNFAKKIKKYDTIKYKFYSSQEFKKILNREIKFNRNLRDTIGSQTERAVSSEGMRREALESFKKAQKRNSNAFKPFVNERDGVGRLISVKYGKLFLA